MGKEVSWIMGSLGNDHVFFGFQGITYYNVSWIMGFIRYLGFVMGHHGYLGLSWVTMGIWVVCWIMGSLGKGSGFSRVSRGNIIDTNDWYFSTNHGLFIMYHGSSWVSGLCHGSS